MLITSDCHWLVENSVVLYDGITNAAERGEVQQRIMLIESFKVQIKSWEYLGLPELPELSPYDPREKEVLIFISVNYLNDYAKMAADATAVRKIVPVREKLVIVRTAVLKSESGKLFKNLDDYQKFKKKVDSLPERTILSSPRPKAQTFNEYLYYDLNHGSDNIKMLETEKFRLLGILYSLKGEELYFKGEQGMISSHSFDTATPDVIQEAIDSGRIKPFERTLRSTTEEKTK